MQTRLLFSTNIAGDLDVSIFHAIKVEFASWELKNLVKTKKEDQKIFFQKKGKLDQQFQNAASIYTEKTHVFRYCY